MKQIINEELNRVKKELYFNAAARYFDETGYKHFKISDLAKELETSVGTIYNLFGSKEELYVEYLILKLETFLVNLKSNEGSDPLENLKTYLKYKYAIFIQTEHERNKPITSDPYFFHKLDISNHSVVDELHQYLIRQLRSLIPCKNTNHKHLAIIFKKISDGFIESYLYGECQSDHIVDETIEIFFQGVRIKN
ncbi:MAG TPA: TetR/AcrR family transcriptional regulator [Sulfuricurvum sp.]|nr:TetR/AcrR family transcriptional regulator [Sulfuricurvum sp.]HQT36877.1 TetR/AcrR family transcriptional regulator [Sulfuricurvum sp.]